MALPLAGLTWRQTFAYRDAETLYRATLASNPTAWLAQNDLALFSFTARGPTRKRALAYRDAVRLNPARSKAPLRVPPRCLYYTNVAEWTLCHFM